jgi:hypothetical protein
VSEVQDILHDSSILIDDRIEKALTILDDIERYRCKDGKFRVIYISYDEVNGMKYVGQHTTENLNDGYLGSGLVIQRILKKYGKERFDCGILEYCKNRNELNRKEKYWIKYFKLKNQSYNIGNGGTGGDNITDNPNYDQIIAKMCIASSGRFLGNHHSEATKHLQSLAKINKSLSKEHKNNISKSLEGRVVTENTRELIKKALKSRSFITCFYCGWTSQDASYMKRRHFDNCIHKFEFVRTRFNN